MTKGNFGALQPRFIKCRVEFVRDFSPLLCCHTVQLNGHVQKQIHNCQYLHVQEHGSPHCVLIYMNKDVK